MNQWGKTPRDVLEKSLQSFEQGRERSERFGAGYPSTRSKNENKAPLQVCRSTIHHISIVRFFFFDGQVFLVTACYPFALLN